MIFGQGGAWLGWARRGVAQHGKARLIHHQSEMIGESLTKKAEPPRTYDTHQPKPSRTTRSDTRGWLRRLVRAQRQKLKIYD